MTYSQSLINKKIGFYLVATNNRKNTGSDKGALLKRPSLLNVRGYLDLSPDHAATFCHLIIKCSTYF